MADLTRSDHNPWAVYTYHLQTTRRRGRNMQQSVAEEKTGRNPATPSDRTDEGAEILHHALRAEQLYIGGLDMQPGRHHDAGRTRWLSPEPATPRNQTGGSTQVCYNRVNFKLLLTGGPGSRPHRGRDGGADHAARHHHRHRFFSCLVLSPEVSLPRWFPHECRCPACFGGSHPRSRCDRMPARSTRRPHSQHFSLTSISFPCSLRSGR